MASIHADGNLALPKNENNMRSTSIEARQLNQLLVHGTTISPSTSPDSTTDDHLTDTKSTKDEIGRKRDTSEEDQDSETERRASIVRDLARQYTHQSQHSTITGNPFEADQDSPLNPKSEKFRALAWAKSIVKMSADNNMPSRKMGVCYQNLSVFGYGQATDYQKNVANVWFELAGIPRRLMGYGKTRIDILRDFDGVVQSGEMLVVLGPPGAGCSTFLKTIAGETSGIYVNEDAYFNYRGEILIQSKA